MTDIEIKRQYRIETHNEYIAKFSGMPYEDIAKEIGKCNDADKQEELRLILVNDIKNANTLGYLRYDGKHTVMQKEQIGLFERELDKIKNKDVGIHRAYLSFAKGDYGKTKKYLTEYCGPNGTRNERFKTYTEGNFAINFLVIFKNAFPGFWEFVLDLLKSVTTEEGVVPLCETVKAYYEADSHDEQIDILTDYMRRFPDSEVGNELLAYTYYEAKMWANAIAYFERANLEQSSFICIFYKAQMEYFIAYSYSRVKDHKSAIRYYEESLSLAPNVSFLKNDLGYEYYIARQYDKALKIFKECIDDQRDIKYSAGNYVRTLIAMGRLDEAKAFVDSSSYKIPRDVNMRLEKALANGNKRYEPVEDIVEEAIEAPVVKNSIAKSMQFSTEKLLEDELEIRINSGVSVFGHNLKIYRRKGEYGRQYIIPIGRLDLLCEDDDKNLYIIELKKDRGYDDAYQQTRAYMDWFDKNKFADTKKVYGIICLNNPTDKLKKQVRMDDRVQLFEYAISYSEIK